MTTGRVKAIAAAIGTGGTATAQIGGTPWWVFGLAALACAAGWEWLRPLLLVSTFEYQLVEIIAGLEKRLLELGSTEF